MAILQGDIKLVASEVMDDVPEGGGGPTANLITDGQSNNIFPDISEADRAIGRVNARKTFVHVQTADRDTFLGANFIVATPPNDPNVSITAFQALDFFDERTAAQTRLESYLAAGPLYPGYIFGNMLAGQMTVTVLQKEGIPLPLIGSNLVLKKAVGTAGEVTQFVRTTGVSTLTRDFEDERGTFRRVILTLSISDPLRVDFPGFDAQRTDPTFTQQTAKTTLYESVVADAARYYGTVPLTADASIGDVVIEADGIYTKLVPSAQIETPIADARTNQLTAGYTPTGAGVTQTVTAVFSSAQALYVGGGILPSTLSVVRDGVTVTDAGGVLYNGATQVGTVDYQNGLLQLSSNVWGTSGGTHTISFTPAVAPQFVSQSIGIPITIDNRSLSYVLTLEPAPARASLNISYLVAGRWYVLQEDGTGAVRGSDPSFGVGNLNYTTGTLALTLGALPDVGSAIIVQWVEEVLSVDYPASVLDESGKLFFEFDTAVNVAPGTLQIAWNDGSARTVTDNGAGALTGYGTGSVDYFGKVRLSPTLLPAPGTVFTLTYDTITASIGTFSSALTDAGANFTFNATAGAVGRLDFKLQAVAPVRSVNDVVEFGPVEIDVMDNGFGLLVAFPPGYARPTGAVTIGTINYTTGACTVNKTLTYLYWVQNYYTNTVYGSIGALVASGSTTGGIEVTINGGAGITGKKIIGTASPATPETQTPTEMTLRGKVSSGLLMSGVQFTLGANKYTYTPTSDDLILNPSPNTGLGTVVGSIAEATGYITLTTWPSAVSPAISNWRAVLAPPTQGLNSPFLVDKITFRTSGAPLRPSSLSVLGTLKDGTTFNVTAASDGTISHTRFSGTVNYETGVVQLSFNSGYPARPDTIRYNAVAYTYLPLDASIIGLDPVRLPSDGRVPIFRAGSVVVVGNTDSMAPATVSNGQTLNTGRTRLSRVRVVGNDGETINTGYTADLEAGTVTFTDVTGYSQPVTVEHRIEDMALVADAQINGTMRLTRALTHEFPVEGTYVSSAIMMGDLRSRVSLTFDQASWDGTTWSDDLVGSPATGTYNTTLAPILVTNEGAVTERWALRFTSTTAFQVIGENVGVIATGSINATCAPLNPATGVPYFTISDLGWGAGWSVGNIVRLNTVGAMAPIWLIRTIQQGPSAGTDYSFSLLTRGDVDRP